MTSNEEKGENINKVCLWEALEYNVRWGLKQVSKFNGERVKCFNGIKVGRKKNTFSGFNFKNKCSHSLARLVRGKA